MARATHLSGDGVQRGAVATRRGRDRAARSAGWTQHRLAVVGTFMVSPDAIYRGGWVQIYGP